jgi:hypothetical protein
VDSRESRRAGGAHIASADAPADAAADAAEAVEGVVEVDRPEEDNGSDVPWAAVGIVVLVLVTGAFASGWHFGRRWGRLMGW